ncbi:unnamed protein product [Sphagnum compactum]
MQVDVDSMGIEVHELKLMKTFNSGPGLDILFVHGSPWNENVSAWPTIRTWRSAWTHRDRPNVCWPEDWLPQDLGDSIRVLSVSYDDAALRIKGIPKQEIANVIAHELCEIFFSRRQWELGSENPVVLVGHKLGGDVIENLVMEAKGILKNRLAMTEKCLSAEKFVRNVVQIAVYGRQSIHDNQELNKDLSICDSCSLCLCNPKSGFVEGIEPFSTWEEKAVWKSESPGDHRDLWKPPSKRHESYTLLLESLRQAQHEEHWKSPILQHWKDLSKRFSGILSEMTYALKIQEYHFRRLESFRLSRHGDSTRDIIVTAKIEVPAQRIQFLFENAKSMAMVVGVGLDFATVYLSRENVITVEKINQFEWKRLWEEAGREKFLFGELCMEDTVMSHDDYGLKSADGSYIILLKVFALYVMARYFLQKSYDVAMLYCTLRGSTCLGMPSGKDKIGDKRKTHDGVHWPTIPIFQFLWDYIVGKHGVGCKCYHGEGDKDTIQDGGSATPGTNIGGQKVAQKHDHEDMPRAGMVADERWHKGKESISAEGARNYGHGDSPSEGGEGGGRNIGGEKDGHNQDHENVHKVGGEDGEGHAKVEEDPSSRIVEFPFMDIFSKLNLKGNEGQSGAGESTSGGSGESTSGGSGGGDTPGERGEGGGNPDGGDDNRSSSHDGSGSPSKKTPLETTVIVSVHPQYQDTNFHWEKNGTRLQPDDQNLKDININPELELQFLKTGDCKKVMTKISVSFDIAAAKPDRNDENRFGWFQKGLSASLQCLSDNAARLAHNVSRNVRETKITNKKNSQTTPGPWQRTGTMTFKPPFLEVAFAGGKPTTTTSTLHEDSMETSIEHILGGFIALDESERGRRHRLAYVFEHPNPPKDIKDTQCLDQSRYSGMCHTVYAVIEGTWDDLNDEEASEYHFRAHRTVCELTKAVDSKKRVSSVLKELMQIYEMKLYINHNMTNICNLENITLRRRPDTSPLVSVGR